MFGRVRVVDYVAASPGPEAGVAVVEPVTTAELAAQLRIDETAATDDLTALIATARDLAERITGRAIIRQELIATWDRVPTTPEPWYDGVREGIERRRSVGAIDLPRAAPLVSVESFTTYAEDDTATEADLSRFIIDRSDPNRLGRVVLRTGQVWPTALRVANALEIDYIAGWTRDATPPGLKRAILMMAAWMFAHRGDCDESCADACGATPFLAPFRMIRL